ncbi:hypothetical protein Tco_1452155, partial [Tanacetum coccineum]
VMAFSVSSISSDSLEESVGTSTARVILFGTIPTTIPPTTPTIDLLVIHGDTLKSVRSLPSLRLASRHPSDSSSSDSSSRHFSSSYAISDSLDDSSTASSVRPSRKRCRSLTSSIHAVSLIRGALSPVCTDLSPPLKRIWDSNSGTDLEVILEDDYEPYVPREVTRGMDDRDVVETAAEEDVESKERDTVEVEVDPRVGPVVDYDVCEFVREDVSDYVIVNRDVEVTYETLGDLVQRFHDHVVEIPVYWIQVIESEQRL